MNLRTSVTTFLTVAALGTTMLTSAAEAAAARPRSTPGDCLGPAYAGRGFSDVLTVDVIPHTITQISPGQSATFGVYVWFPSQGGTANLSLTGLPSGVTRTFAPSSVGHCRLSVLTISSAASTAPGTYALTVHAETAFGTASKTFFVLVNGDAGASAGR
ncbi:hypothetical protein [Streptosporangium sp. NPDC051022]|uniref:hypothetical protein n=1 Tax=Streptosporangium sp. NPDC051022 TaxID=3155752 RepID=UPI00341960D3